MRILVVMVILAGAASAQTELTGTRAEATRRAVVNFSNLPAGGEREPVGRLRRAAPEFKRQRPVTLEAQWLASYRIEAPVGPSPVAVQSFLALVDDNRFVPPDTMGAVGPNHVMTALNSQIRIHSRAGNTISTVDMSAFWSGVGVADAFDPHVVFDAGMQRWIFTAMGDGGAASGVLVAVSQSEDPTGDWNIYRVVADPAVQVEADYDNVGFNDKWIVVTANMFGRVSGVFEGVRFYVFSKMDLATNGPGTVVRFESRTSNAFSIVPAVTQDAGVNTLYMVEDWDGGLGQLRISTITGAVGGEVVTIGTSKPTTANRWDFIANADNILPQLGSGHGIDAGDSRVLSCVLRNGSLWIAQTALLPHGAPARAAAQWWEVTTNGTVQQFGRVDDATGASSFAYPTLAVNASNDVLLGYSRFGATQYASANYAFRFGSDPVNRLRADTVLKAGEGPYFVSAGGINRWGDYSATCLDPTDDSSLWTIQEYATTGNRWATWWGRVNPDPALLRLVITRPVDGLTYPVSPTITLEAGSLQNVTFTNVEYYAGNAKLGAATTAPFRFLWSGATIGTHELFAIGTDDTGAAATSSVITVVVGDSTSPIGMWEAKLTGTAKGTVILSFHDDLTLTGHGMVEGLPGLLTLTGTWEFGAAHQPVGTLDGIGDFTAKVAGPKFSATVENGWKLKAVPVTPVPNLAGQWTATLSTGVVETWQLTPSSTFTNVFDWLINGNTSGSMLITAKGAINAGVTNAPQRSLTGKTKDGQTMSLKGDEKIKAVKQ